MYDLLQKEWEVEHVFHQKLLLPTKVSACVLERKGMTIHKITVSQEVPENWVQIAQAEAKHICQTF